MKLSDRLTRAGLVFILLGTTAAFLPEDGNVEANTGQCSGPSHDYYRLTTDPSGTTDPTAGPYANGATVKLYFFESHSGTGSWTAFAPTSSSMADVTGSFSGNTFTGIANNTSSSNVTGSVTAGASGVSVQDTFTVSASQAPAAPGTPTATASTTTNSVTVNWPSSTGATGYNVLRSTTSGGPYATTVASNVSGNSVTDSTVAYNTKYYYVVQAVNSAGTSTNSTQASATTIANAPPSPPTNLAASEPNTNNHHVDLTWSASATSGVTYNLYAGTTLLISGSTNLSYTDKNEASGTTVTYKVTAVNGGVESTADTIMFTVQ